MPIRGQLYAPLEAQAIPTAVQERLNSHLNSPLVKIILHLALQLTSGLDLIIQTQRLQM
jgi:hypothetical protein